MRCGAFFLSCYGNIFLRMAKSCGRNLCSVICSHVSQLWGETPYYPTYRPGTICLITRGLRLLGSLYKTSRHLQLLGTLSHYYYWLQDKAACLVRVLSLQHSSSSWGQGGGDFFFTCATFYLSNTMLFLDNISWEWGIWRRSPSMEGVV